MRQVKPGSYVQVIKDTDSGLLIGRKGTVKSLANDKIWVSFDNHRIPLPFNIDELKAANKRKKKTK